MHAFHIVALVLAASAAVPVLSIPLPSHRTHKASPLAARDPAPSGEDIRDLLNHFNLRSEDVIAALYGRDVGTAEQNPDPIGGPASRLIVKSLSRDTDDLDGVDHAIARDDSEPFDSLRRDGLADDIQARRLPKHRAAKFGLKKKNQGGKKIKLRGNDETQGEGSDESNEGSDGSANEGRDDHGMAYQQMSGP